MAPLFVRWDDRYEPQVAYLPPGGGRHPDEVHDLPLLLFRCPVGFLGDLVVVPHLLPRVPLLGQLGVELPPIAPPILDDQSLREPAEARPEPDHAQVAAPADAQAGDGDLAVPGIDLLHHNPCLPEICGDSDVGPRGAIDHAGDERDRHVEVRHGHSVHVLLFACQAGSLVAVVNYVHRLPAALIL